LSACDFRTRFELWRGAKPDVSTIPTYGTPAYDRTKKEKLKLMKLLQRKNI